MSSVGWRGLLFRVSQELTDIKKINQILYASSSEGLISENSESFNIQVNPGDNTAVTVMKLFSDLEKSDNLGLDNLEVLRDLLKGVKEWSLVDAVDKFERQRKDFSTLLETIIPKLDELDNLEQLLSLCEDHISDDAKDDIKDVRSLVKELQKKNRLGVARLTVLRKILNETGQQELLDLLTEFEKKWKEEEKAERRKDRASDVMNAMIVAPTTAVCSTVKQTLEQLIGAVKILCKFSTPSEISLEVGTGTILRATVKFREFVDDFKEAVLPAATNLRTLSEGSLCLTVQAENMQALRALWERYQDGTLQRKLQEFLVTDYIRQLASGEEVILSAYIDEQDYNNAWLSISIAEQQVLQKENQEISPKRARRNSDSSLHATGSNGKLVVITQREQIKLYQERIKALEEEIEKMRAQEMSDSEASGATIPQVDDTKLPSGKLLKPSDLPAPKDSIPWHKVELPVDALLLTVKDCEFLSCVSFLNPGFYKSSHSNLGYVYFGKINCGEGNTPLKIAITKRGRVPYGSILAVKNTVTILKPKAVFFVGYCCGLSNKIKLGDVVISSKLRTYAFNKETASGIENRAIIVPSEKQDLAKLVLNADAGWKPQLKDEVDVKVIKNGVILSGPEGVDNEDRRAKLIERFPDATAIETEGDDLYAAVWALEMEWVVIKGVSDFADGTKSATDAWKSFASVMAASLTAHILSDPRAFEHLAHYEGESLEEGLKRKAAEGSGQVAKRRNWVMYGPTFASDVETSTQE